MLALGGAMVCAAAAPASAAPLVGATLDPSGLTPQTRSAELSRLADSGAHSVRVLLDWNRVEPRAGKFTWRAYDEFVDAALARKLEVVLILGPCAEWAVDPAWEVPPGERAHSVPRSPDLWERYVREAVSHFRGRVRHWQVRPHPDVHQFRGARREYLRLLDGAAEQARARDPEALIIVPEAGALGIAALDALLASEDCRNCDIVGLYFPPPERGLSATALAWSALAHELLGADAPGRPIWVLGSDAAASHDQLLAHYALAAAFGVERCYLPAEAVRADWVRPLEGLRYRGFLRLGPVVWALAFDAPDGPVLAAWASEEIDLAASDLAPIADPEAVKQAAALGRPAGSALASGQDPISLRLGPRPALVRGFDLEASVRPGPPTRRDVLAGRGLPDLQDLPFAYADYSMDLIPEFGIYNRALRSLPGGRIVEEDRIGRAALRTSMTYREGEEELDNPYMYFDVDDSWLYFNRGRRPVVITVECERCFWGEEKVGFNIIYESTSGYRFTRWQWAETGYGWTCYRFQLDDASFTNRDGYDFRINAKGSKQDPWIATVSIEKLPTPSDLTVEEPREPE